MLFLHPFILITLFSAIYFSIIAQYINNLIFQSWKVKRNFRLYVIILFKTEFELQTFNSLEYSKIHMPRERIRETFFQAFARGRPEPLLLRLASITTSVRFHKWSCNRWFNSILRASHYQLSASCHCFRF